MSGPTPGRGPVQPGGGSCDTIEDRDCGPADYARACVDRFVRGLHGRPAA